MTGVTSGAGNAYPSGEPEFSHGFSGVRVTRSLGLCVCFVDRCLSFCPFSFGHCVVKIQAQTYPKFAKKACNEWPLHMFPFLKGVILFSLMNNKVKVSFSF